MFTRLSFRKVIRLLSLLLIVSLAVIGVGYASARSHALPGRAALEDPSNSISVGLITDEAGVTDMGFNWMAFQGLQQAVSDFGVVATVYTPTNPTDYEPMFQLCADDGNTLCISSQWLLFEAIYNVSIANPGTYFAAMDSVWQSYPSNLRGMRFSESEAGYMAGTLAGLMTQSDVVGGIGGPAYVPAVVDFIEYYRFGAQCANPAVVPLVTYADSFIDPAQGAALAQGMLDLGADVIFAAAGPTGIGAMTTTVNANVWAIGVDVDMYVTVFGGGSVPGANWLLSSAMKRADQAVYSTIEDVVNTNFTSGTVVYDLAAGGVGLAPFHEADPFVSQQVRDTLAAVEQGIIGGAIDINETCRPMIYLPVVTRDAEVVSNPGNGHFYSLVKLPAPGVDWYEARDLAAGMVFNGIQGHLATITSQQEEDFLFSLISPVLPDYIWLGASDELAEGNWEWVNGEAWGFTGWYIGEPNGGTSENCLQYGDEPGWNDAVCLADYPFLLVEFSVP